MNIRILFIILVLCNSVAAQQPTLSSLLAQTQSAKTDSLKIAAFGELADYYFFTNIDSAAYYAIEGRKLAQKANIKIAEADMIGKIASIRESHGNLTLTEKLYNEALAIYRQFNAQKKIAEVNNGLGVVAAKKGNFNAANNYFMTALKIYTQLNDEKGKAHTYIKLGALSESIHELDKALAYYNKSKTFYKDKPVSENSLTLYNNIGVVYAQKDSLAMAAKLFLEGVAISDSAPFAGVHIMLLTNAGNAYSELGKPDKAKEYLNIALSKARQYKMQETEARALLNLAGLYVAQNLITTQKYLDSSLTIARSINHRKLVSEIYEAFGDLYKEQKNYKAALEAYEKRTAIKDSIFTIQKTAQIAAMQADYETEEANQEIKQLKLTNEQTRLQRNIGTTLTIAVVVILFTLLYSFLRLRHINKKLLAANQVRDKLFSIIGHDLKGPMASQSQMLDMLQTDDFSVSEHKDIVQELAKQSASTLTILNALLNWGNIQLQGVKINPVSFHARPTVAKTISIYAKQAEAKSIIINNNIPEGTSVFTRSF